MIRPPAPCRPPRRSPAPGTAGVLKCRTEAGCVMLTVRERARVIDEGYGPGSTTGRPSSPWGIPVPIHTRVRIRLFSPRTWYSHEGLARETEKRPLEPSASVCPSTQDDLTSSNMRATLLTLSSSRRQANLCQSPTGVYLIRRTLPQDFAVPKKRGNANHAGDKPRASLRMGARPDHHPRCTAWLLSRSPT